MPRRLKPAQRSKRTADRNERLLQSLLDLYQLLRSSQTIDDVLQAILDMALDCVPGAQRGSLMVREGDYVYYRAVRGYDLQQLKRVRFPAAAVSRMIPAGQRGTQISSYAEWDVMHLDAAAIEIIAQYGHADEIRCSLMASIIVAGQFFGTLALDNLHGYTPFPAEAKAMAVLFAEQTGAVIEQAQLLAQLRRTSSLLAESEKLASLGRLVAGVAHEINNPLTAVLGHAELLQAEGLSAEAAQSIEQIRLGANRVRTIVRNLQIFARQQHMGQSEVDLNYLVDQVIALKHADFALDQIDIRTDLAEHLPLTWGDAGLLSQVLLNLLVNAQYALGMAASLRLLSIRTWSDWRMPAGEESAGGAQAPEQWLAVSVSDTGPGIPAELQPRIFEPFFTTKPVGQGTGLGLSVCYGIIADHGGRIWAESMPGQGATFVVELPVRSGSLDPAAPAFPTPRATAPRGRRILLLDDDELVIQLVRDALAAHNTLEIVRDGVQGVLLLRDVQFDVLLCDLRMAGMNGIDFYHFLARYHPELLPQLMFISGDTSSATTHDFLRRAGRPLLSKPFTPSELYQAIASLG